MGLLVFLDLLIIATMNLLLLKSNVVEGAK